MGKDFSNIPQKDTQYKEKFDKWTTIKSSRSFHQKLHWDFHICLGHRKSQEKTVTTQTTRTSWVATKPYAKLVGELRMQRNMHLLNLLKFTKDRRHRKYER